MKAKIALVGGASHFSTGDTTSCGVVNNSFSVQVYDRDVSSSSAGRSWPFEEISSTYQAPKGTRNKVTCE